MIHLIKSNKKGVSEVIGFVLIILIAIGTSAFVVGSSTNGPIESLNDQSQHRQIQNTFSQISSSSVSSAINGQKASGTIDLAFTGAGSSVKVKENSSIRIWAETPTGTQKEILQKKLGYIKYKSSDGSTYYYENGGVWRIYENREVNMITPPEFYYNNRTLTLPLIKLNTTNQEYTEEITFKHSSTNRTANRMVVDDEVIHIKVTGPTYLGWGHYFKNYLNYKSLTYNHKNNTVIMTLGIGETYIKKFNKAILASGDIMAPTGGSATISGDIKLGSTLNNKKVINENKYKVVENSDVTLQRLDPLINSKLDYAKKNGTTLDPNNLGGKTLESGVYYIDGNMRLDSSETLTVDVGDGDVILAVNGDIYAGKDSHIKVINTTDEDSGKMKTYLKGDLKIDSTHVKWTSEDTGDNIVYGTSDTVTRIGPNGLFEGVIYAPANLTEADSSGSGTTESSNTISNSSPGKSGNSNNKGNSNSGGGNGNCGSTTATFCISRNSTFKGAIVTASAELSSSSYVAYDSESLGSKTYEYNNYEKIRPKLAYLHTSTTTVEVTGE